MRSKTQKCFLWNLDIGSLQNKFELSVNELEIILDKMNILLVGLYKPPFLNKKDFLLHLNNNSFCVTYESKTQIGYFNMMPEKEELNDFCEMNKFQHLVLKAKISRFKQDFTTWFVILKHFETFQSTLDVFFSYKQKNYQI